jgi:NAD(P)-dependent dehydrogenase (short-subunit alcohol dehydrogenase family)
MSGRLTGKRALITGAAQGLGAAIACRLAVEGAHAADGSQRERREGRCGGTFEGTRRHAAFFARHDVSNESDRIDVIDHAREQLGGPSVLVDNAGIVLTGSVGAYRYITGQPPIVDGGRSVMEPRHFRRKN